ncbi:MAG: ABC transporter permease [Acidobacteria bacterium]|nr:MAG: ABC transporter permease [Acidobacteriota bacterium]
MRAGMDRFRFALGALVGHRLRSSLSALGVAIGVAAVILLTSLGEGTRDSVISQFTQFGTDLLAVNPGKIKTFGMPGMLGGTTHKLTIDDSEALRQIPGVKSLVPMVIGQARVEGGGKGRSVFIYGVGHEVPETWQFPVGQGRFLPATDPRRKGATAVLGPKLSRELFGEAQALGRRVRIAGAGLLVVGIMEPKGQLLGFDLGDAAYVPVATAMDLFNVDELNEIDVLVENADMIPSVVEDIRALLIERHRGEEDFTITTQAEMLDTFGRILGIITVSVSGIAAVSLLVGGMGILTIMWISVTERTREIGLLRSLGVTPGGISRLFLTESIVVAVIGGLAGIVFGLGVSAIVELLVPSMPLKTPLTAVVAAMVMSLVVGVTSGWLPALRAARMDPIEALREE